MHEAAILEARLDQAIVEAAVANDRAGSGQDLGTMVAGGVMTVDGAVDHERDTSDFFSVAFSAPLRITAASSFDAGEGRDLDLHLYVNGELVGTLSASDSYEERDVELQTGDLLTLETIVAAGMGPYELVLVDWSEGNAQASIGNGPEADDGAVAPVATER